MHRGRARAPHGADRARARAGGRVSAPALPRWADIVLLPLVNLAMALVVAGGGVALLRQNPVKVPAMNAPGAFGSLRGVSFTLSYTTTLRVPGLAVALSTHGRAFTVV